MTRCFEINEKGYNIRCRLYAEPKQDIRKVVLFCHGFAGHKDNATAAQFAEKLLSKYKGVALITFNLPCHGDDVRKKLTLEDCSRYLSLVIDYVNTQYADVSLYGYGVSFGGYLLLKHISEQGNPFRKAALRSPAIDMYDSMTHTIIKGDEYERLQKGKSVLVGFDRKIEISSEFLAELKQADLRKREFIDYADDLLLIHGTADEIVPYASSVRFAEDNVIELFPIEGADHRVQNPRHRDLVTKYILDFFTL